MEMKNTDRIEKAEKLNLEAGAFLRIRLKSSGPSVKVVFVGMKKGKFIVVTPPVPSSSSFNHIFQDGDIIASYISCNTVYEFKTSIIRKVTEPVDLILLEYPDLVQIRETRSIKRINCLVSVNAELKSESEELIINGVIEDISKNGCRCLFELSGDSKRPFAENEELILTFSFPGVKGEQKVLGQVRNIQFEENEIFVGIEFLDFQVWAPPYI